MTRLDRIGWIGFGLLLAVNVVSATLQRAQAQNASPAAGPRARCVGVAAGVGKDGGVLVFRAFEDGTVEERRAEKLRDGKIEYAWKPALRPAD